MTMTLGPGGKPIGSEDMAAHTFDLTFKKPAEGGAVCDATEIATGHMSADQ